MTVSKVLAAAAAASLMAAPALAAPVNPAASLSVVKSVRASTPVGKASQLNGGLFGGGGFIAVIAVVAVIVGIVLVADDNNSNPSSN